jgi:hypothetical protein
MAFGNPTRYLPLDVSLVAGGSEAWDRAVREASDVYKVSHFCHVARLHCHMTFHRDGCTTCCVTTAIRMWEWP